MRCCAVLYLHVPSVRCPRLCAAVSCAGSYVWGYPNANDCPAPSSVITDYWQCKAAASYTISEGHAFDTNFYNYSSLPRGCFLWTGPGDANGFLVFNGNAVGTADPDGLLLCAVPVTGVRLRIM